MSLIPAVSTGHPSELSVVDTVSSGTNGTSFSFASTSLGAAFGDRHIVVAAATATTAGTIAITGVTVGGISATEAASQGNDFLGESTDCAIWVVRVPTGTTGTVVISTSIEAQACAATIYRVVGINKITPHDTDSGTGDPVSMSLNIPAGGFAIGVSSIGDESPTVSWTGLGEDADGPIESNALAYSSASSTFFAQQAGLSVVANFSVSSNLPTACCASWGPGGT